MPAMAIFTWWNGATLGTALFTRLRGLEVGRDELGNLYYQHRKDGRRWVVYSGSNDGARVPPEWQHWLRGTIDDLPDKVLPPRRSFEKPAVADPAGQPGEPLDQQPRVPGRARGDARGHGETSEGRRARRTSGSTRLACALSIRITST